MKSPALLLLLAATACSSVREPALSDCTITTSIDLDADGVEDELRVETTDREGRIVRRTIDADARAFEIDLTWEDDCAVLESSVDEGAAASGADRIVDVERTCDRYGDVLEQDTLIVDSAAPSEPFFNEIFTFEPTYPNGRERRGRRTAEVEQRWDELGALADPSAEPDQTRESTFAYDSRDRLLNRTVSTVGSEARTETEQSWWENSDRLLSRKLTQIGADGEVDDVREERWARDEHGRPTLLETFVNDEPFSRESWTWEEKRWAIAERRILENDVLVLIATYDCDEASPASCVESLDFGTGNDLPDGQPDQILAQTITCR